jgi:hypothetical protein
LLIPIPTWLLVFIVIAAAAVPLWICTLAPERITKSPVVELVLYAPVPVACPKSIVPEVEIIDITGLLLLLTPILWVNVGDIARTFAPLPVDILDP